MRIEYRITNGYVKDGTVTFTYEGPAEQLGQQPAGKMITDSDEGTFVYLFEDGEDYKYLHFTQGVWPLMQLLSAGSQDPMLACSDAEIVLNGFTEELTMLVFNIEGNGNYGETFMLAVEEAFADTLQTMG
ncbi:hypothetical protein NCCP2716_00770 [Sporosarcina sp. NCCP-2716]|uniref:UPF0738 family protein n=1 Tax=Sporosarcina sp. NCCP-2716 TaxID=2943679 RepID=UPI0020410EA3|nr:hypothetical protein [Sporosarcina sp. NCCP-2716]GKV67579.1 hypothetical protein NCCP2716_00770 [Sporosarcina sp. NCCP-2716]